MKIEFVDRILYDNTDGAKIATKVEGDTVLVSSLAPAEMQVEGAVRSAFWLLYQNHAGKMNREHLIVETNRFRHEKIGPANPALTPPPGETRAKAKRNRR